MSIPLFHIESEQSVLGGLLIDPKAFDRIDWLHESDFYREDHRLIFRHVAMMLADRQPVDVVTVAESLASAGVDEDCAGLAYLGELAMNTPSAANIRRYAEVVSAKRALRDWLAASAQIADLANAEGSKPIEQRILQPGYAGQRYCRNHRCQAAHGRDRNRPSAVPWRIQPV